MLHMLLLEMLFSEYCIIFSHAIFFWAQPLTSFLYLSDRSWGHWHQISSVLMDFHSSLKLQTTVWRITEVTEGQRDSWKTLLLNWSYHAINCNHSILDNKSNKKSRDRITHQSNGRDDSQRHGWIYTHTRRTHALCSQPFPRTRVLCKARCMEERGWAEPIQSFRVVLWPGAPTLLLKKKPGFTWKICSRVSELKHRSDLRAGLRGLCDKTSPMANQK